jgi:hypothetical protein
MTKKKMEGWICANMMMKCYRSLDKLGKSIKGKRRRLIDPPYKISLRFASEIGGRLVSTADERDRAFEIIDPFPITIQACRISSLQRKFIPRLSIPCLPCSIKN